MLSLSFSAFDLGCVKTHTSPKCRKYGSLIRYRALGAQYDSALLMAIAPGSFHALGNCWSFHTAKTHLGHQRGFLPACNSPNNQLTITVHRAEKAHMP